ncbi:MAG: DUF2393 domain-containing protein [Sulfuricurvum sp.]|jgi:hypothetical protein|uniref:DUF2393 family protein n=1 Tax=Sulfuricurvum sp. TaxID=2025608 RepID=UPI0025F44C71|nr:DUF2393 family protein [Sulfuricurvum sp.]MCK9371666.1 DUF2393 domain-containing protein [Sulfuricurvum sp.]
MKALIQDFIARLIIYDYLLIGGVVVLFIILLLLAILIRHKMRLAIFLVILAFGLLTAGSVWGYMALHHYLFQHTILLNEVKALEFTEALLIKGDLNNTSQRPFHECTITAKVYKVSHNKLIDPIYPYIPFKKNTLTMAEEILPGHSASFKLFIEPFRYAKDYNVTVKGECR